MLVVPVKVVKVAVATIGISTNFIFLVQIRMLKELPQDWVHQRGFSWYIFLITAFLSSALKDSYNRMDTDYGKDNTIWCTGHPSAQWCIGY